MIVLSAIIVTVAGASKFFLNDLAKAPAGRSFPIRMGLSRRASSLVHQDARRSVAVSMDGRFVHAHSSPLRSHGDRAAPARAENGANCFGRVMTVERGTGLTASLRRNLAWLAAIGLSYQDQANGLHAACLDLRAKLQASVRPLEPPQLLAQRPWEADKHSESKDRSRR